jgi:hypothetical protein
MQTQPDGQWAMLTGSNSGSRRERDFAHVQEIEDGLRRTTE